MLALSRLEKGKKIQKACFMDPFSELNISQEKNLITKQNEIFYNVNEETPCNGNGIININSR